MSPWFSRPLLDVWKFRTRSRGLLDGILLVLGLISYSRLLLFERFALDLGCERTLESGSLPLVEEDMVFCVAAGDLGGSSIHGGELPGERVPLPPRPIIEK